MKTIRLLTFLYLSILSLSIVSAFASDPKKVEWKSGQIVAISEMLSDPSTFIFEIHTGSRYGHIGIIYVEADQKVSVYESAPPEGVRKVSLANYLANATQSKGQPEFTLLEPIAPLSPDEIVNLHAAMEGLLGIPYNQFAKMTKGLLNCSEFVQKSFEQMGRNHIGEIQSLTDMNTAGKVATQLLQISEMAGENYEPTDKFISPVSIVNSKNVKMLVADLPVGKLISEDEVVKTWKARGGVRAFESMIVDYAGLKLPSGWRAALNSPTKTIYRDYPPNWRNKLRICGKIKDVN